MFRLIFLRFVGQDLRRDALQNQAVQRSIEKDSVGCSLTDCLRRELKSSDAAADE